MLENTATQQPSNKRMRADTEADEDDSMQNSVDFWFDDGNLILDVEHTRYRVHRNVLSRHSLVFCDMLKLPQADTSMDSEGASGEEVQAVRLHDSKKDWDQLLELIYDPHKAIDGWNEYPIDSILAILRLGHKYQFDRFENVARKRMIEIFPTTFEAWKSSTMFYNNTSKDKTIEGLEQHAYDILAVVQETGLQCVLPATYLFCLWTAGDDVSKIFRGITRKDGTLSTLPSADQEKIVVSKEMLIDFALDILDTCFGISGDIPTKKCLNSTQAENQCRSISRTFFMRNSPTSLGNFFKSPFFNPSKVLPVNEQICCECGKWVAHYLEYRREQFWDVLPVLFDLPPWEELPKSDFSAESLP